MPLFACCGGKNAMPDRLRRRLQKIARPSDGTAFASWHGRTVCGGTARSRVRRRSAPSGGAPPIGSPGRPIRWRGRAWIRSCHRHWNEGQMPAPASRPPWRLNRHRAGPTGRRNRLEKEVAMTGVGGAGRRIVGPGPLQRVGAVHPGPGDADHHLSGRGLRNRPGHGRQHLGAAGRGNLHGAHGLGQGHLGLLRSFLSADRAANPALRGPGCGSAPSPDLAPISVRPEEDAAAHCH